MRSAGKTPSASRRRSSFAAAGDLSRFLQLIELLQLDWRDVLVAAGLAHGDWPERLRNELPNQSEPRAHKSRHERVPD
jgi:hypothetical protein